MRRRILNRKRIGILLILLFVGASTGLVVANNCHLPSENVAGPSGSSHAHVDGGDHFHGVVNSLHNVAIAAPQILDSVAGELCLGIFLLVLLMGRRYQWQLSAQKSFKAKTAWGRSIKMPLLYRNLKALTLPQLGLLRI